MAKRTDLPPWGLNVKIVKSSITAAALAGALLTGLAAAATPARAAAHEIDRIDITGITAFTDSEIESALEVGPGEPYERMKVVRSAENLDALYKLHGYDGVRVHFRFLKNDVLEFQVEEGLPTRVSAVDFIADGQHDPGFSKYWQRLQPQLLAKAAVGRGDVFDQEKIATAKRALQDVLASEEFIGAKVDDVRVRESPAPALPASTAVPRAARWIALEYHIDLGERVSFGFRDNTVFPSTRLLALIEEQRVLGFGKDYVTAIKSRIEDEYRSEGYQQASLAAYTFESPRTHERHVTYVIAEGPRVQIESIEFDGNTVFSNDELREIFEQKASVTLRHGYFVEKDVQKAAELLIEELKSRGYLAAKLTTINTTFPPRRKLNEPPARARVVIYLYEGDQTLVQSVRIDGLTVLSPEQAKNLLQAHESLPLNLFAFGEGIESLKTAYRARGYLNVRVLNEGHENVVRYSQENRAADIYLDLSEGPQFRASRIEIEGLQFTREYVVRREIPFHDGDVLEEGKLTAAENNLHRLGIFSGVSVRAQDDPERAGYKVVRISLVEGTPGVVAGGVGLRNDLGVRVFGQTAYTNVGGRDQTVSLNLAANRRFQDYHFIEYEGQLGYLWPWFMGKDYTFRPTFTVSGTQYKSFDADSATAALTWEKQLLTHPSLVGIFTYSIERDVQFNAQSEVDHQGLRIGGVTPAVRLDLRDNPLSPTRGFFALASYEYTAPALGSQAYLSYSRFIFRSDYFLPLAKDVTWYFSFRTGYEQNNSTPLRDASGNPVQGTGEIPLIKQFAIGGASSLRGYAEQELNFYDAKQILGSLSYVNYRTQLDLPLAGALRFGPFLDAANLRTDVPDPKNPTGPPLSSGYSFVDDLKYGAGFGFHYQTPVGPVNLDFGYKLNPDPGTDLFQFYFSVGII